MLSLRVLDHNSEERAMADVVRMSSEAKIEAAMRRSLPRLGPDARAQVEAMLSPESLAIIGGTVIVWAGSHFFGVGEVADVILLVVGFTLLGTSAYDGARELIAFAQTALGATNDAAVDEAAEHFSRAVVILGITTISAILLRKSASGVVKRGAPRMEPMPNVGRPPLPGTPPPHHPSRLVAQWGARHHGRLGEHRHSAQSNP